MALVGVDLKEKRPMLEMDVSIIIVRHNGRRI
jgi:hypothetical protein